MSGNGSIINLRPAISRTSSQKSGQRFNPESEANNQQSIVQVPKLQRYHSVNLSNKQLEYSFNPNQNNKNDSAFNGPDSNLQHQRSKPVNQGIQQQQNHTKQAYNKYKQMCKDLQFIQMLGNPRYVVQLFDRGYFYSNDFKDYIHGLRFFLRSPHLIKLIKFPEGLYNLQQMLKKGFVQQMEIPEYRNKFIVRCLKRNLHMKKGIRRWKDSQKPPQQQIQQQFQKYQK